MPTRQLLRTKDLVVTAAPGQHPTSCDRPSWSAVGQERSSMDFLKSENFEPTGLTQNASTLMDKAFIGRTIAL
jgi:hypothetical protein